MLSLNLAVSSESVAWAFAGLGIRGTAVLGAAWIAATVLRRASAATRHLVWLAAIVALMALPVLTAMPGWRVIPASVAHSLLIDGAGVPRAELTTPAPNAPAASAPHEAIVALASAAESSVRAISIGTLLIGMWAIGAVLTLVPAVLGRVLLRRAERRAQPAAGPRLPSALDRANADLGLSRPVRLLIGSEPGMPMAWGILRPRILLPADAAAWPASQVRAALVHELAHIKRHDCATLLLAQVARALYWCNPLVWLAVRRLHAERERACDDMVLAVGTGGPDYARDLLLVTAGRRLGITAAAAMAMARPSYLEGRIRDILDGARRRGSMTHGQIALLAGVCALVLAPIGAFRTAATGAAPTQPNEGAAGWMTCSTNVR